MFSISKRIIPSLFLALIIGKLTSFTNKSSDTASELGQSLDSLTNILNSFGVGYLKAVPIFNEYGKTGFETSFHLLNYLITYTILFLIIFHLKDKLFNKENKSFSDIEQQFESFRQEQDKKEMKEINKEYNLNKIAIFFLFILNLIKSLFNKLKSIIIYLFFSHYRITTLFIFVIMFKITDFHNYESFDFFVQSIFFICGVFILNILNYFFKFVNTK